MGYSMRFGMKLNGHKVSSFKYVEVAIDHLDMNSGHTHLKRLAFWVLIAHNTIVVYGVAKRDRHVFFYLILKGTADIGLGHFWNFSFKEVGLLFGKRGFD